MLIAVGSRDRHRHLSLPTSRTDDVASVRLLTDHEGIELATGNNIPNVIASIPV